MEMVLKDCLITKMYTKHHLHLKEMYEEAVRDYESITKADRSNAVNCPL